ncbi:MAG: hypothetical protein IT552_08685 [Sphingomonadaceae bacterium]|nr:hypothetical protein [Sphingomonadaceae bacterium]
MRRRYVPGPDADELLVWYEGSGLSDKRFLTADQHGSVPIYRASLPRCGDVGVSPTE